MRRAGGIVIITATARRRRVFVALLRNRQAATTTYIKKMIETVFSPSFCTTAAPVALQAAVIEIIPYFPTFSA